MKKNKYSKRAKYNMGSRADYSQGGRVQLMHGGVPHEGESDFELTDEQRRGIEDAKWWW